MNSDKFVVWALTVVVAAILVAAIYFGGQAKENDRTEKRLPAAAEIAAQFEDPLTVEKRTGVPVSRARSVVLDSKLIHRAPQLRLRLELFSDVVPTLILRSDSSYDVNEGIFSGEAEGDPESRVKLTVSGGMISAFITYQRRDYRIVADPARGAHYIIEVRKP